MTKLKAPIFIPSKNRPDSKLVKLIVEQKLPLEDFYIVVEHQNLAEYETLNPELSYIILPENDQGISYVRNYIKEFATNSGYEWFWMIDDDVDAFYKTVGKKNVKVSIDEALNGAFDIFTRNSQCGQASIEYQQYAWSATKPYALNSYCDVCVCINTKATKTVKYRPYVSLKEDRDFTLQVLSNGYDTMRVQRYSFSAPKNGSNKGGLSDVYAKQGREQTASERMVELWGSDICTLNIKSDGRPDVKINWRFFKR